MTGAPLAHPVPRLPHRIPGWRSPDLQRPSPAGIRAPRPGLWPGRRHFRGSAFASASSPAAAVARPCGAPAPPAGAKAAPRLSCRLKTAPNPAANPAIDLRLTRETSVTPRRPPRPPASAASARPAVDVEATHDYPMVMTTVGIAELKAHLSEHLQAVRRGETIVVLDRREPIARIVPIGAAGLELVIRPASGALHDVKLLGPSRSSVDVMEQLREERAERL